MNALFADWHSEVAIGLAGEVLTARSEACDALAEDLSGTQVLELIAAAHERPEPAGDWDWFREAVKAKDATFLMRNNPREVAILAGAAVWQVLDGSGELAVLAAYGIELAHGRGWSPTIAELVPHAGQRLQDLGAERRELFAPPQQVAASIWTTALKTSLTKALGGPEPDALAQPAPRAEVVDALEKLAAAVQGGLTALANHSNAMREWANTSLSIALEEGDIMGWLLTGASLTTGAPWVELTAAEAAPLAGRELAQCVARLPAPPHADAVLVQLLASTRFATKKGPLTVPGLEVPAKLKFLLDEPTVLTSPQELAQTALREALILKAWAALE